MAIGPVSPIIVIALWLGGLSKTALVFAVILLLPFVVKVRVWPAWCRWYLSGSGWFDKPVTIHFEEGCIEPMRQDNGTMWYLEPLSLFCLFALNSLPPFSLFALN